MSRIGAFWIPLNPEMYIFRKGYVEAHHLSRLTYDFGSFDFSVWMLQATNGVRIRLPERHNLDNHSDANSHEQSRLPSLEQHANSAVLRLHFVSGGGVAECEVQLAASGRRQHHCARVHHLRLFVWVLRFEEL